MNRNLAKALPTILAFAGSAGVVVTSVLAAQGHVRARDILDRHEFAEDSQLEDRIIEAATLTWRDYAPAVISGAVTIACIMGSNKSHLRTEAALAAVVGVVGSKLKGMDKEIIKEFGEDKLSELKKKVDIQGFDKKKAEKMYKDKKNRDEGDIYFEPISEQYFWATEKDMLKAQIEINKVLHKNRSISLAEILDILPSDLLIEDDTNYIMWCIDEDYFDWEPSEYGDFFNIEYTDELLEGDHQAIVMHYSMKPGDWSVYDNPGQITPLDELHLQQLVA